MGAIGIISAGAALLNYRNAVTQNEAAKEEYEGAMAALAPMNDLIKEYNSHKYDQLQQEAEQQGGSDEPENWEDIETNPVDYPNGVKVATLFRVANLVGNFFLAKPTVYISNEGSERVYIKSVDVTCIVLNEPVILINRVVTSQEVLPTTINIEKYIQPGEVLSVPYPTGKSYLKDGKLGELRKMICEACGKKLITSCYKVNIDRGQKAEILIKWYGADDPNKPEYEKTAGWIGLPGTLRYCGEAGLS